MEVADALMARRSTRAYLDRKVPKETVARILSLAARAPSGNNTQPWRVDVLTGPALARLSAAILAERQAGRALPPPEYPYYPAEWPAEHLARRRENGWALYNLIGVTRGDKAAATAHHDRNFTFFGAPVGMILSVDRRLGQGALIDLGLFLQSLALSAQSEGLATCLQAAFNAYHDVIRRELALDPTLMVVCGVALGFADPDAPINGLRPPRDAVQDFTRFHEG